MATGENIVHANKEFLFTSESVTEGPAIEPFIYGSEEFETELRVLQGAGSLLQEQTPQIFCEIHHDYLESLGQSTGDKTCFG